MNKLHVIRKLHINIIETLRKTKILPLIKIIKNDFLKILFKKYDSIFCDITNICNLRCPHCYNNWKDDYLQKTLLMSKEHFEKALQVATLTPKGNFLLSCAFEPTLHPKFNEMLRAIPVNLQKQIAFTTNLSTNISEEVFETLSRMRLHHINISLESFTPEIYEQCRKNAQYERFINNLDRLVYHFKKKPKSPRLRFITLVTSLNSKEIPSLIQKCHTQYHAYESEIRYPWTIPGPWNSPGSIDWLKKHVLSESDWEKVVASIANIPFRHSISSPQQEDRTDQQNILKILWIRPDGLLRIQEGKNSTDFHLDTIENPYQFFKKQIHRKSHDRDIPTMLRKNRFISIH